MHQTHSSSGPLSQGPILTVALLSACCLLLSGASPDVTSPKILRPKALKMKACLGDPLVIPCKADPGCADEMMLIYWLVNRSFIEHAHPDGRIRPGQEETDTKGNRTVIRRDLLFQEVTRGDFEATYICVVSSAAGIDRWELRLKRVNYNCIRGRKWEDAVENVRKRKFRDV